MSRRQRRSERAPSRSAEAPSHPSHLIVALTCAALILAALGGGMIYDRAEIRPGLTRLIDLVGVPLAAILGSAGWLLVSWSVGGSRPSGRIGGVFIGLFLWCGVSTLFSAHPAGAWPMLAVIVGAAATGAAVRLLAARRESAIALAVAIAGAASAVSAAGVGEYLERFRAGNALWRVFGGFVNPDFLAGYLLVALPVTAGLFLMAGRPALRILAGLALLLQTACLVLTGSRLGLAALILEMMVFALLLWRSSARRELNRTMALTGAAVVFLTAIVAGGPVLRRLLGSGAESHSAKFRLLTWQGTLRMAAGNAIVGTGPGTFETAYPSYQVVGYTQHAHNGWLQAAAETGGPGLFLLMLGLASTAGFGAALLLRRRDREDGPDVPTEVGAPDLVVLGCVAGIVGSAAHNLFDSDFHLPAVAFTLAGAVGLILSRATPTGPDPGQSKVQDPKSKILRLFPAAIAVWLVGVQGTTALARVKANDAAAAFEEIVRLGAEATPALYERAIEGYRSARELKPSDPEFALRLAGLYEPMGRKEDAERVLRETADRMRLGKAYYRYGRFLERQGRPQEAYEQLRKAREREPNNLQTLLALASMAKAVGKPDEAEEIYRRMIRLYRSDFGAVRPMPELVDWEFGMAYAHLGELQLARGERDEAVNSLKDGAGILGEFWRTRNLEIAVIRIRAEVRKETSSRYEWALEQLVQLHEEGRREAEALDARRRLEEFRKERDEGK